MWQAAATVTNVASSSHSDQTLTNVPVVGTRSFFLTCSLRCESYALRCVYAHIPTKPSPLDLKLRTLHFTAQLLLVQIIIT